MNEKGTKNKNENVVFYHEDGRFAVIPWNWLGLIFFSILFFLDWYLYYCCSWILNNLWILLHTSPATISNQDKLTQNEFTTKSTSKPNRSPYTSSYCSKFGVCTIPDLLDDLKLFIFSSNNLFLCLDSIILFHHIWLISILQSMRQSFETSLAVFSTLIHSMFSPHCSSCFLHTSSSSYEQDEPSSPLLWLSTKTENHQWRN